MKKIVAGLTGGIASGKSVAAEIFREAGAYIIDADIVAREVASGAQAKAELYKAFPDAYIGGGLDRRTLRKKVFADDGARKKLDSIMHPLICAETERLIAASSADITVVVAPLLFEAGFDKLTSPNITVSCPESLRIERLKARDNISEELALNMVRAQLSDREREKRADTVVENDGSMARLRAQVLRIYCELSDLSKG